MSRSLGDLYAHEVGVSPEPVLNTYTLGERDLFLVSRCCCSYWLLRVCCVWSTRGSAQHLPTPWASACRRCKQSTQSERALLCPGQLCTAAPPALTLLL